MSSRGSNFSDNSRRNMSNEKAKRSRIGDSPLTYKGFEYQKAREITDNNGLTVADSYKHGPTPSERMKKFNGSQPPLVKNIGGSMHSSEYNKFSMPINTTQDIEKPKDMTQNLRLLKDKIRVGSAGSEESEPYSNIKIGNNSRGYAERNSNLKIKNSENRIMNSFEDHNSANKLGSQRNVDRLNNSSRKAQPIKADHRVLGSGAKPGRMSNKTVDAFTPQKAINIDKPYETASGNKFMRSTQKSVMSDEGDKYIKSEEIERLKNPQASMTKLSQDLTSKGWETQVNACNVLRSIAIHDTKLIDSTFMRSIIGDIIKIASSLRSSVSKNGMLLLQDLFEKCPHRMEFELKDLTDAMIKKGSDTNVFISAEAEKSLLKMAQNCNESKVLSTVLEHARNRSHLVKMKVARCLEQLIIRLGKRISSFSGSSKLLGQLATYLSDASQDVRSDAKHALKELSNMLDKEQFQDITMNNLDEKNYSKVKDLFEKGFQSSMSDFNPTSKSFYRGSSNRTSRKTMREGGSASNGFDYSNITKTPSKYRSSQSIVKMNQSGSISRVNNKPSPSSYSKRSLHQNSYDYGTSEKKKRINKTYSEINNSSKNILRGENNQIFTDNEDNKTMKSTPNNFSKNRRIARRNIRKLNQESIPQPPDFRKRETVDADNPTLNEKDVFARLKDHDSKVSSRAAEYLINNYEENKLEIPSNLRTIMNSQAALY